MTDNISFEQKKFSYIIEHSVADTTLKIVCVHSGSYYRWSCLITEEMIEYL